jgi:aminopeptidase N
MQQWTYEQGYPVVTVGVDQQRRVWLHQARFGLGGIQPCNPDAAWWIPIRWVGGGWMACNAGG